MCVGAPFWIIHDVKETGYSSQCGLQKDILLVKSVILSSIDQSQHIPLRRLMCFAKMAGDERSQMKSLAVRMGELT